MSIFLPNLQIGQETSKSLPKKKKNRTEAENLVRKRVPCLLHPPTFGFFSEIFTKCCIIMSPSKTEDTQRDLTFPFLCRHL